MNTDKFVGLDVHKDTIVAAIAEGGRESVTAGANATGMIRGHR